MATTTTHPADPIIHQLIEERGKRLKELRELEVYTGYDDFYRRQYESKKLTFENAIKDLEARILKHVNFNYADCKHEEIEIIISKILVVVPKPKEEPKKRIFHPGR